MGLCAASALVGTPGEFQAATVIIDARTVCQNMEGIGSKSRVEMEKEMFRAGGQSRRKEVHS